MLIRFWKPVAISVVAVGTAVAATTAASAAPAKAAAPRMSATALANGIVFNQGPAAKYLTSFKRPAIPANATFTRLKGILDNELTSHPAMAAQFAQEMQSGNRVEVTQAAAALNKLVNGALTQVYGAPETARMTGEATALLSNNADNGVNPDAATVNINEGFNLNFAADTNVVAAAAAVDVVAAAEVVIGAVLIILVAAFFSPTGGASSSQGKLVAEEFTNVIAAHLKAA